MKAAPAMFAILALGACARGPAPLAVCADPDNMPFSNRRQEGFENRLAALVAADLGRPLRYQWWSQRRGYVRNTLGKAKCDMWPGVASGVEMVATTRPWYRSSYVFVTRADRPLANLTLDDPRLRRLSIGVQMVGNDATNTPPAHALAVRGITGNVHGFMIYRDPTAPAAPAPIIAAVANRQVDVALAWGPLAGWYAKSSKVPLRLEPVRPWLDRAQWPMAYDISMGVRRDDPRLLKQLDTELARRRTEIATLLADYGVPVVQ